MKVLKTVLVALVIAIAPAFNQVKAQDASVETLVQFMVMMMNTPQMQEQVTADGTISECKVEADGVNIIMRMTLADPSLNISSLNDDQWQLFADTLGQTMVQGITSDPSAKPAIDMMRAAGSKIIFYITDAYGTVGEVAVPI